MRKERALLGFFLTASACALDEPSGPSGVLLDAASQGQEAGIPWLPEAAPDANQILWDAAAAGARDAQSETDAGATRRVRFVVLGDGGTGDEHQAKVAAAMATVCAARGCEFALYLGDNIYESGASGANDAQFQSKFEEPYAGLDFPFYVALGNHDYGSEGTNLFPEDGKSAAQVEYTAHSQKWNMPDYFYTFREGPVAFFALDTNAIVIDQFRPADVQKRWLDAELARSDAPWKIVFGHHPYISNGEHGNAGKYVGSLGIELHSGATLQAFVEDSVCGKAQLFLAGHDHDREWLEPTCGTSFIVSGAGAKLSEVTDRGSPSRWSDAQKRGFLWVEVDADALTGVFYDEDGQINFEDVIER